MIKGDGIIKGIPSENLWEIADGASGVVVDGMGFEGAKSAFYATNSNTLIGKVSIKKSKFFDISSAILILDVRESDDASGIPVSVGVDRFELIDCEFESVTNGSVIISARTINSALVRGNKSKNCNKRWLQLGNNFVPPVTVQTGKYIVTENSCYNQVSTDASETQAILLYGERADVYGNHIDGVDNSTHIDCEGIYVKCRHSEIFGNTVKNCNATTEGGAITAKTIDSNDGFMNIHHNQVFCDEPPTSIDTIGIFLSTAGEVAHNTIHCVGKYGVYVADYGRSVRIIGNQISCVGDAMSAPSVNTSAIFLNTIPTQPTYAAGSTEDRIYECEIRNNKIDTVQNQGVYLLLYYSDSTPRTLAVCDNIIHNIVGSGKYGIMIYNNSAEPSPVPEVLCVNNVFDGMASAVRLQSGASQSSAYKTRLIFNGNLTRNLSTSYTVSPQLGKIVYGKNFGECVTDAAGTASIAAAATNSGTVTAPLSDLAFTGMALRLEDIQVVPTSSWGAANKWWIEIVSGGAGQFRICCDVAPGGAGFTFSYRVTRTKEVERS